MVGQSPLNRRGWVYQERLLSPRILHFAASQVFWECKVNDACETYPSSYSAGHIPFISTRIKRINPVLDGILIRQRDGGSIFNSAPDAFLDGFAIWKELVANYSGSHLTQPTDRLVAFSGIASKVQEVLEYDENDYLAGMWKQHLPYNLTWQAVGENNEKPANYTAPSWSWASITGKVQRKSLKNLQYQQFIEIVKGGIELAGPSKLGQVRSGFLELKGSLISFPLSICQSNKPELSCAGCMEDAKTLSFGFTLDISRSEVDRIAEARQKLHFPISGAMSFMRAYPEKVYEYRSVYGMPILGHCSGERQTFEGLLLEATETKLGEFRRIGTFSYECWGGQRELPSEYLEAFRIFDSQAINQGLEPILTDHRRHESQYMIRII